MKKTLRLLLPIALFALPATAQDWSIGGGTGPFVFGTFVERTVRASTGGPDVQISTIKLSAATRPGLIVDVERNFNDRFALRLQGTFVEAPLKVKSETGGGVAIDAGKLDVTTLTLPLIIRINPRGSFRFHIKGGPAYAMYHVRRDTAATLAPPVGTRSRFGGMAGAGLEWAWSKRLSVEGEVIDIVTSSPFEKSDFIGTGSINIPKTHNEHAMIGLRWHF